jgi:phosphopentomutase
MKTLILIMVIAVMAVAVIVMAEHNQTRIVREKEMVALENNCNICLQANNVSTDRESENRFYSQVFVGSNAVTDDRLLATHNMSIIENCYSNCTIGVGALR